MPNCSLEFILYFILQQLICNCLFVRIQVPIFASVSIYVFFYSPLIYLTMRKYTAVSVSTVSQCLLIPRTFIFRYAVSIFVPLVLWLLKINKKFKAASLYLLISCVGFIYFQSKCLFCKLHRNAIDFMMLMFVFNNSAKFSVNPNNYINIFWIIVSLLSN